MITCPTSSSTAACTPWMQDITSPCMGSRSASNLPRQAPTTSPSESCKMQPQPPEFVCGSKAASQLTLTILQLVSPTFFLATTLPVCHYSAFGDLGCTKQSYIPIYHVPCCCNSCAAHHFEFCFFQTNSTRERYNISAFVLPS